ncbi:MAG: SynChlorMet cassette protein ScmD [Syntrophales bacterium]|nr:SynChlorMet cassette protein ScmD [Syntrophales bacterium]
MELLERKLIANPEVILRQEFDDWAILFDPDSGNAFGTNPLGVLVFTHLDGRNGLDDILKIIRENADNVPEDVDDHVRDFMKTTVKLGLASYVAD